MAKKSPTVSIGRETFWNGIAIVKKNLAPYKRTLIILSVAGLLNAAAQAFGPLVTGKIFDSILGLSKNAAPSLTPVFILLGAWLALQLASNILGFWSGSTNDKMSTVIAAQYTAESFGKLYEMPLSFHAEQKQGDVSDRISRASNWLDNIINNVLLTLLPSFLSIGVALVITAFLNVWLMLLLLAAILAYSLILWRAIPALSDLQKKMHRAYNRAYGDAYDAMGNIKEIKQAATELQEKKKLRMNFVARAAQFWINMDSVFQRLNLMQKMLVTGTQLGIFVLSIFFVQQGTLTLGGLVAFNGYAAMVLGPFIMLGQNWQTLQNGLVAIVRAEKILATPPEIYEPKGALSLDAIRGEIEFQNVSFSYKKSGTTLKNISFHVHPGEKVALVGESGVGKSTLIDLLAGFYVPQEGTILIDGIDLKKLNLRTYRSRVGVVPQEPALFNDTIEANLRYGNLRKSREEMYAAASEAYAAEFIERFPLKYKQRVGWRGVKLSIGQKQRLALARAFLRNPDILVLDEPTSALDARSEHLIKASLQKLMAGRTTFVIAHRLSTIREADTILVLKDGNIVEHGKHQELVMVPDGIYRSLYELQSGIAMNAQLEV